MSDEDKLYALVLALLASGRTHHEDCVGAAQRVLKQLKDIK